MQVASDTLICDYCLDKCSIDFIYYSLDFKEMVIYDHSHQASQSPPYSIDLCERCMGSYCDRVKKVYRPPSRGVITCDVSGELIQGNCTYYKCRVSKVAVRLSGKPYVCSTCGGILKDENAICEKCVKGTGIRRADIDVDKEYLELIFSKTMYDKFIEHIKNMRGFMETKNG